MQDGNTTLTISIPASLKRKIKAAADREHRPMSNMIRLLLQQVLEDQSPGETGPTRQISTPA